MVILHLGTSTKNTTLVWKTRRFEPAEVGFNYAYLFYESWLC